jgi:hypothetical protein
MAGHTFLFISLGSDAEIVDLVDFTDGYGFISPGDIERFTFPGPMGGSHQLSGGIGVAFQAGSGYVLASFEGSLDDISVACMSDGLGNMGLGVVGWA